MYFLAADHHSEVPIFAFETTEFDLSLRNKSRRRRRRWNGGGPGGQEGRKYKGRNFKFIMQNTIKDLGGTPSFSS